VSFDPTDIGWRLGRSRVPHGVDLWCRYDRTCGVFGEQGSGKTLDLLAPALLAHHGPGLATLTKLEDLLLTAGRRQVPLREGDAPRPIAVLDPFGRALDPDVELLVPVIAPGHQVEPPVVAELDLLLLAHSVLK